MYTVTRLQQLSKHALTSLLTYPPTTVDVEEQIIINTHYYNSNVIWRTKSRRVDEVIPSDHLRREDVIQCARSRYYYNKMFII